MGDLVAINGTNGHARPASAELSAKLVKADFNMLREAWPWLEPKIEEIRKKDKESDFWTAEHVWQLLLAGLQGRSTHELWLAIDSSTALRGFIVTYTIFNQHINLPVSMFVWLGWGKRSLIRELYPTLKGVARERHLKRIEFSSGRKGWLRAAARQGFRIKSMTFCEDL
jgi:hypothetical protein